MRRVRWFCEHAAPGRDHCRACELARAERRRGRIVALYLDGHAIERIATVVSSEFATATTPASVRQELHRVRASGRSLPYRRLVNTTDSRPILTNDDE